ncbi:VIR protein [Plasmodium vivax]|uniref:VIR protein n=1 Tax=Plasmodium vivax TaxID=5855 RepID=A0A1G4HET4_PLAVI|nr:VIR protein [Plasmodium vivax]
MIKPEPQLLHNLFDKEKDQPDKQNICDTKKELFTISTKYKCSAVQLFYHTERIINKFDNLCQQHDSHNNCCDYFIYWLYRKIIKSNYDAFNIHWLLNNVKGLMEKYNLSNEKKCKLNENFSTILDINLLKNKTALYYFLEYYDKIKKALNPGSTNKYLYCQYIKQIFRLYQKIQQEYRSKLIQTYIPEITKFRMKFDTNEITFLKWSCNDDPKNPIFNIENIMENSINEEDAKVNAQATDEVKENDAIVNVSESAYGIFYNLNKYKEIENLSKNDVSSAPFDTSFCNRKTIPGTEHDQKFETLCKNFIKFFLLLNSEQYKRVSPGKRHFDYLNYWLNDELKPDRKSVTNFIKFLDERLDKNSKEYNDYFNFKNKIYNMNEDIYDKMHILYNLYDNYSKIIQTSKSTNVCSEYSKICAAEYKKGIEKYLKMKSYKYYNALKTFRNIYNSIQKDTDYCIRKDLEKLPELTTIKEKEKKEFEKKASTTCQSIKTHVLNLPSNGENLYDVLDKSSAHKKYKKLNDTDIDESDCTTYCKKLISLEGSSEDVQTLCAKMITNLKTLPTNSDVGHTQKDRCSVLSHWTRYHVMNLFSKNPNSNENKSLLKELNDAIFNVNEDITERNNRCQYYLYGNWGDWKEEKDLHDYFENYDKINENAGNHHEDTPNKYCKYLSQINNLYKKYIKDCCMCFIRPKPGCEEKCPKYFKCEKKYYPYDLISKLNCPNTKPSDSVEEIFKSVTLDHTVVITSQIESLNSCNGFMCEPFYKYLSFGFSLLGVFFILFLFYKVTSVGSSIYKKKRIKREFAYNSEKGHTQALPHAKSKSKSTKSKNQRIRIAYHTS